VPNLYNFYSLVLKAPENCGSLYEKA